MRYGIKQNPIITRICNQIVIYQIKDMDTSIFVPSDEVLQPILDKVWNCRKYHGLSDLMVKRYTMKRVIYSKRKSK